VAEKVFQKLLSCVVVEEKKIRTLQIKIKPIS